MPGSSGQSGAGVLETVIPRILDSLTAKNAARERALGACRSIIRLSANSIRAVHRLEFERADGLLAEARAAHLTAIEALSPHGALFHAGFLHDAQKELVEAHAVRELLSGGALPTPESLGVEDAAYLNGIAEAVGELRRMLLDKLRRGQPDGCEELLRAMDDIYDALVTVDFPDAMTGGLRRTPDQTRGILERTRGDLTMAMVQREVMSSLERRPRPRA